MHPVGRSIFCFAFLTLFVASVDAKNAPLPPVKAEPTRIVLVNNSAESKAELQLTFELSPLVPHYEVAFPSASILTEALKKVQKPKGSEVVYWQDDTTPKMLIAMPVPPNPAPVGKDDNKLIVSYPLDRWEIRYFLKPADPADRDSYTLSARACLKKQPEITWDPARLELVWDGAKFEHKRGKAVIKANSDAIFDLVTINKIPFEDYRPEVVSFPSVIIPTPAARPAAEWSMTFNVDQRLVFPTGKLQFTPPQTSEPAHLPGETNWPMSLALPVKNGVQHRLAVPEPRIVLTPLQPPKATAFTSIQIQCNQISYRQTQYLSLSVVNNTGISIPLVAGNRPQALAETPNNATSVDIPTTHELTNDLFTAELNLLRQLCAVDCRILKEVLKYRDAIDASLVAIKRLRTEIAGFEKALQDQQLTLVPAIVHSLENQICNKRMDVSREQVKLAKARFDLIEYLNCQQLANAP